MVFTPESKWSEIKRLVDGETKLDAATLNGEVLRLLVSRTDYLREHLETLMEALKIIYDPNDTRTDEEKQADPRLAASVLQLLANSRVDGRVTPQQGLMELPTDSVLTTDDAGRATWRAIADVVGSGSDTTPTPTEPQPAIKSIVVLEERKARDDVSSPSGDISPSDESQSGLFRASAWNYVQTWGEEIITKFYNFEGTGSTPQETTPTAGGQWNNNYPLFFGLKKGNYMIDGVINLIYARTGQCRLSKVNTNDLTPGSSGEDDFARHTSAIYGSNVFATRTSNAIIQQSVSPRGFNSFSDEQLNWADANNSASSFHSMITEDFFEGKDEINVSFETCFSRGNNIGLTVSQPELINVIWALGINGFDEAPPGTINVFKRLRIVKV